MERREKAQPFDGSREERAKASRPVGNAGCRNAGGVLGDAVPAGHDERKQREANVGVHGRNNVGGRRANDRSPVHESIMEGAR